MRDDLKIVVASILAAVVPGTATAAQPLRYRVETVDGLVMSPIEIPQRDRLLGLNSAGIAVGARHTAAGVNVAIRVEGGVITDLPTPPGYAFAEAWMINDSGMIVGDATNTEWTLEAPVIWSGGTVQLMPVNAAWGYHATSDINDAGVIVGTAYSPSGPSRAWQLQGGVLEQLPLPDGFDPPYGDAYALGINSAGDVVGAVVPWVGDELPVLWREGEAELLPLPEGVTMGGAIAINDVGEILGGNLDHSGGGYRSFIWNGGEVAEITPLPAGIAHIQATDLNNRGQVVGQACTFEGYTAFLWESGVTHDLQRLLTNPLGVQLSYALEVNDDGMMIGAALVDGQARSVLLLPVTCIADWQGDGSITSADISAYLTVWLAGVNGGTLAPDINGDGTVTSADIAAFLAEWLAATGEGC